VTKLIPAAFLLAVLCCVPAPASAQIPGPFVGAEILPVNGHLFGAYLVASDNVVGGLGQLRLSFYPGVDFGFQGGLARLNYSGGDRTSLRLGTDVRVRIRAATEASPYDVSVGGVLGVETGDDLNNLSVGPVALVSRSFGGSSTGGFTTYAGLGAVFASVDAGKLKETNLTVPLRLGALFKAGPGLHLVTDIQFLLADDFNDDVTFTAGVNLPF
jgi:hypothetical protein